RLIEALEMPVMHDDQHGTAVVVLAALYNALEVVDKEIGDIRVVISGAGAAGIAVGQMLLASGVTDLIVLDSRGTLHTGRAELAGKKREMAERSNPRGVTGGTAEALEGADVFIGVSSSKVPEADIARMSENAIVFALSNPDPEVDPAVAHKYAAVVATGRSDYPNQINNVLAFPGIFRGALDGGARRITESMKLAAARAIADLIEHPVAEQIVPSAFTPGVAEAVARAVMESANAGE
ncbi:MAG TPA: NAD-dependent malic enzyme, partial [Gaiellaceae bacterium]|nr:NAD-dependent malic enzyme [Gaiellaceae bacterium]